MTDLVLTRHGETIWHSGNRYAGRTDIPLNQCGQQQAQLLGRWAKRARLDAVWVSPLARARDTAAPAAQAAGVRPHADDRLVELDFGDAEGLTGGQMRERFPEVRAAFESDPVEHHLPGGEDPRDALQRAISCLTEIVGLFPDGRVLIVWHGTIHRLVLCHLLGMPLRDYRRIFPSIRNCGLTTVRWRDANPAALREFNVPIELASGTETETVE